MRLLALRSTIALANGIGSDLSIEVYRSTLYQPYAVHLQRKSSEAISAIANQVDQVVGMINGLLQLLTAGLVSLGIASLLVWLNPLITLAVALVVVVATVSRWPQSAAAAASGTAIVSDQSQLIRSLQEGLGAIRDVILDCNQSAYTALYGEADRRLPAPRPGRFLRWRLVMGWRQLAWWPLL